MVTKILFPKDYCCQKRCKSDCLYCKNEKGTGFYPEFDVCPYYVSVSDQQYEKIKNYKEIDWINYKNT